MSKRFPKNVRAVCFDLDGVLIHTMPLHAKAWIDTAKAWKLQVSRREVYEWEGESGVVTATRLLNRSGLPSPSSKTIRSLLGDKERRLGKLARRVRVPNIWLDTLLRLKKGGLSLGLVTGTSRGEIERILSKRALNPFDVIVTGDSVKHGKPHPEPYSSALRHLGIKSRYGVVVENAPFGIRSAKRANIGFVVALASSLPRKYLFEADLVIDYSADLRNWLHRLV